MKSARPKVYSTYTRTILSETQSLADLIRKYANISYKEEAQPPLISPQQLTDALANPQSPLRSTMAAYASLLALNKRLIQTMEDALVQRRLMKESLSRLRDKLDTANPVQQKDLHRHIKELDQAYQETMTLQKNLAPLEAQIGKFKNRLDKYTFEFDQEWEAFRAHYLAQLFEQVNALEIRFSERELQELSAPETWPEVIERFVIQNIGVPSALNLDEPDYSTYFRLKAYLAIHAALGRRLLPNQPEDVMKYLKKDIVLLKR
ncbi:MAG: hypothetical protein QM752_05140 [Gammaproteobacteria bacterium]